MCWTSQRARANWSFLPNPSHAVRRMRHAIEFIPIYGPLYLRGREAPAMAGGQCIDLQSRSRSWRSPVCPWTRYSTSSPPLRPRCKPDGMRLYPPSCPDDPHTLSTGGEIGINSTQLRGVVRDICLCRIGHNHVGSVSKVEMDCDWWHTGPSLESVQPQGEAYDLRHRPLSPL